MWRNYLATAFNNLLKNKLFAVINVAGLAIGLAACLLIALYVRDESAWDKHWTHADRLYRVNTTLDTTGGDPRRSGGTSMLAQAALKDYFPEIEYASRVRGPRRELYVGEVRYDGIVATVDADIVNMLDFDVLAGDLRGTLLDPASIALSEERAMAYFGGTDVIGRELELVRSVSQTESVRDLYRVGAVYRVPGKSVIDLPAMTLLNEASFDAFTFGNWAALDFTTYVQLRPAADAAALAARFNDFSDTRVTLTQLNLGAGVRPSDRIAFDLQPLAAIYLDASVNDGIAGGNKTAVMAFSAIAVLVLLIGCLNFTILGTARATQRAKEVGLRKTIGAGRAQLVMQFMGESFLVIVPAIVLALVLLEVMLPFFEDLVGRSLEVPYREPETWIALLLLALGVGFAGGLYPALVLSWFRPVDTLKQTRGAERGTLGLRGALVVFQFSISIALIIATGIIWLQVRYSAARDPGFDGANVLVLGNLNRRQDVSAVKLALKQEIAALAGVEAVALSGHQPMQTNGYASLPMQHTLEGGTGNAQPIITLAVDENFFDTYGIRLSAGRDYDLALDRPTPLFQAGYQAESPSESNVVINASAARLLGFATPEDALGQRLVNTRGFNAALHNFTIIGVAADTQFATLRDAPRPEVYVLSPQFMADVLSVRFSGSSQQVLEQIEAVWRRVTGGAELSASFAQQNMAREFAREEIEARMLISFALLAIVIACLGLYGSAAFTVERRTKEIGIRKVLGAEVRELVALLLWQFSKPILLANAIAWPVALWAMLQWLQRFPYQIGTLVLIPLCVLAGGLALSIAWLTVAGNTLRVATAKPVLALRYD